MRAEGAGSPPPPPAAALSLTPPLGGARAQPESPKSGPLLPARPTILCPFRPLQSWPWREGTFCHPRRHRKAGEQSQDWGEAREVGGLQKLGGILCPVPRAAGILWGLGTWGRGLASQCPRE